MYRAKADINHATSFYATRQSERDLFEFASNSPARSRRGEVLTNIPEEDSVTDDEPRTFEQEEKYLDECLRGLSGSSEDVINVGDGDCEIEEYDFDDYNSIASTVSLLNIASECAKEDGNPFDQRLSTQKGQAALSQRVPSPVEATSDTSKGLHDVIRQREAARRQDGIAKVQHWDKLGASAECTGDPKIKLLRAAETGDLLILQEVCQNAGVSLTEFLLRAVDSKGNTAVHRSAQFGNLPCLQWLVSQLPAGTASLCNQDGLTPTVLAIQNGHLPCVQWLEERAYVPDDVTNSKHDVTLLHEAARAGHDDILRYLLAHRKDNDIQLDMRDRDGVTPAHLAAREGHLLCLQSLVEYNIDVTARDKDGRTAADYAHKTCQTGCSRYLVVVESCWLLAARVAKLHRELKTSKYENSELKKRLEILERQLPTGLPDRPEADGGDQSDSTCSTDSTTTEPSHKSRRGRSRPKDATPDGQSTKGMDIDRSFYNYTAHATRNGRSKPEGELFVDSQTEDTRHNMYELSRIIRQRGSIDSLGSGDSVTPSSLAEMLGDAPESEQAMAKQIASTTHRLLLSRHAHVSDDTRRIGPSLAREKRDDTYRTPHRAEPVVNATRGTDKQTQPLLPLQYLTRTSETTPENRSQLFPIADRRNIQRHMDKFASSYSSDSNETNSQGFPPSHSTNSSKSNSPIMLSSSSRESSNSSSPILRATAVYGKLEPAGISSDSGSSDNEQEHNSIHKRMTHPNIQSESRNENYKFYTAKSPSMKSNLRHEIQNGIIIRPLPVMQKNVVNNRRIPVSVDEDGTGIKRSFSKELYLGQNKNAVSATTGVFEHKKILTTAHIINRNQKRNEIPLDRKQTHVDNRTFTPALEKSGFTGPRPLASRSKGSVTRINDSNNSIPSSNDVLGHPTHSSAANKIQRSIHDIDTAVSPRNHLARSNQSDIPRNKTNGYLIDDTTEYSSQSRTQNSGSMHPSRLRRTYPGKGNHDNVVWSPTSDHDVTSAAPLPTVDRAGSRTARAVGPKTLPKKAVLFDFDNVRPEQGAQPSTLDNSQAEGRPWYETDDWE